MKQMTNKNKIDQLMNDVRLYAWMARSKREEAETIPDLEVDMDEVMNEDLDDALNEDPDDEEEADACDPDCHVQVIIHVGNVRICIQ